MAPTMATACAPRTARTSFHKVCRRRIVPRRTAGLHRRIGPGPPCKLMPACAIVGLGLPGGPAHAVCGSHARCGCVRRSPEYPVHGYAPTGKPGGIYDIDAFCLFQGGCARDSGKRLFIKQLDFFGNWRNPWHGRRARPRGNNSGWRTIGYRWSQWHRGSVQPGWPRWPRWNSRKRRRHHAGDGWSERNWRAHQPGKRRCGHRGAGGLRRYRGWRGSDRQRRLGRRCLGR